MLISVEAKKVIQYYFYTTLSVAIKPVLLWWLVNSSHAKQAEDFAIFILFQQVIVAFGGTQIHKRLMFKGDLNAPLLIRSSTLEGLVMAFPSAICMGLYFSDVTYFVASLTLLPFEKVVDDFQRNKIYSGDLISHGLLSLFRGALVACAFLLGLLGDTNGLAVYLYSFFALLTLAYLNKRLIHDFSIWRLKVFLKSIPVSLVGIFWSVVSVYLMQLDKFSMQLMSYNLSDYMMIYQVLITAHMGFVLTVNSRYRRYVREQPKKYLTKNVLGLIIFSLITFFMYGALVRYGDLLGVRVDDSNEALLQVFVVINVMVLVCLVEFVFWRYEIRTLLLADISILLASAVIITFVSQSRFELVLISLGLVSLRTLFYLALTISVLLKMGNKNVST